MTLRRALATVLAIGLLAPAAAQAAVLVPIAPSSSWSSMPVHAASPPGDPRLFVVERAGRVRIVEEGVLRDTPFLTVPNVDTEGERGLLSIAFAPDYATSGLFYVFTVPAGPDALDPSSVAGDVRIVEYRRSISDPNLADPASARLVFEHEHSEANYHYAGQLVFGPEGLLYVTMGDAANGENAQLLSNDLGKVLRIDPHDPDGADSYSVPSSNPFVGVSGANPEIYALGLRNPFRASFGPSGELIVADVGHGMWEEVDFGAPTGTPTATTLAGANLGWPECEAACDPPDPTFVDPVFQYSHFGDAVEATGCAVMGGLIVRDLALDDLHGRYLYGDHCRSDLRTLKFGGAGADPRPAGVSLPKDSGALIGFGEDGLGCIYALTEANVYRVAASVLDGPSCRSIQAPTVAVTDRAAPGLRLGEAYRRPLRRVLPLIATCDEPCALRAAGALAFAGAQPSAKARLIAASASAAAGERVRLRLKLPTATFKRASRIRNRGGRVTARLTVTATDSSGNASRQSVRVALR